MVRVYVPRQLFGTNIDGFQTFHIALFTAFRFAAGGIIWGPQTMREFPALSVCAVPAYHRCHQPVLSPVAYHTNCTSSRMLM